MFKEETLVRQPVKSPNICHFLAAIIGLMSQNIKMLHGLNGYILQIRAEANDYLYY